MQDSDIATVREARTIDMVLKSASHASWVRPRSCLVILFGLMSACVLYHDENFLINPIDPIWQHYEPFKWWLLPHGLAGACALLLGPLQFSNRLRSRFRKLPRVLGRI